MIDLPDIRVSEHPRARRGIRRTKATAGLVAFVLWTLLQVRGADPLPDALLAGLGVGLAAYFVAWGAAIVVWRQIVMVELAEAAARYKIRLDDVREAAAKQAAEQADAAEASEVGSFT